jgi:hypothetical protein
MDKAKRVALLKARYKANGGITLVFMAIRRPRPTQSHHKGSGLNEWPQVEMSMRPVFPVVCGL